MITTTINRRQKHEAEQAIQDLLKRGWYIHYPLTEKCVVGTSRGTYDYRKSRYTSIQNTVASVWIAQMRKDD